MKVVWRIKITKLIIIANSIISFTLCFIPTLLLSGCYRFVITSVSFLSQIISKPVSIFFWKLDRHYSRRNEQFIYLFSLMDFVPVVIWVIKLLYVFCCVPLIHTLLTMVFLRFQDFIKEDIFIYIKVEWKETIENWWRENHELETFCCPEKIFKVYGDELWRRFLVHLNPDGDF